MISDGVHPRQHIDGGDHMECGDLSPLWESISNSSDARETTKAASSRSTPHRKPQHSTPLAPLECGDLSPLLAGRSARCNESRRCDKERGSERKPHKCRRRTQ